MGFRDLEVKNSYVGRGTHILNEFLLPVMSEAVRYDRITSYFTIESLLAIAHGIESLFEKNGTMRLIIGIHSVPGDLIEASEKREALDKEISVLRDRIKEDVSALSDNLEKDRLVTLAWMLEDGLLQVKAAAIMDGSLFHPKTLLLKDTTGERVAAIGSPNETGNGLGNNFEQIMVVRSWNEAEAVNDQERFFQDLWDGTEEDVIVTDISDLTADIIESGLGEYYRSKKRPSAMVPDIIKASARMPADFFVSGDIPSLFMHQERAVIDALSRWPVRVLFADEVGLGKTFEVAATITYLLKYSKISRVLILTPKAVLAQWQDELFDHFGIDAWLYDSQYRMFVDHGGTYIAAPRRNPLASGSPSIILMSVQLARGTSKGLSLLEREDTLLPDVLVVDEAHSARVHNDIAGKKKTTRAYKMIDAVSRKIPHIILATATPMQKDPGEYHAMLKLLGLPKRWDREREFDTSLRLISSMREPDLSDSYNAAKLLFSTLDEMDPDMSRLDEDSKDVIDRLLSIRDGDASDIAQIIQADWRAFRKAFIALHPAHLLTIRNTRRSLEAVGYTFPKRNLHEESIEDSIEIQLFYEKVDEYLDGDCCSVERTLQPDKKISIGFVSISYYQRLASSLYSCWKSLLNRYEKIRALEDKLDQVMEGRRNSTYDLVYTEELDDFDSDEIMEADEDELDEAFANVDTTQLRRAISIEKSWLLDLADQAATLLKTYGDLKIIRAVDKAKERLAAGEKVLLFSRYTDTIDALLEEFDHSTQGEIPYGTYTGKGAFVTSGGRRHECGKEAIKDALFAGDIGIVFCSDAASEGLNLQAATSLINVDVPWTPSRLEQRIGRIARLGQIAEEVDIYNVWYPNSIEANMYHRIQARLNSANLAIGEFPQIVAEEIKNAILEDREEDTDILDSLNAIRNSYQVKVLDELWSDTEGKETDSGTIRKTLMALCKEEFEHSVIDQQRDIIKVTLPDGVTVNLSSKDGMDESISLTSAPWRYVEHPVFGIRVENDTDGLPAVFRKEDGTMLKHHSVFKLVSREELTEDDVLRGRPIMLPDPASMDMSFATDVQLDPAPVKWIE